MSTFIWGALVKSEEDADRRDYKISELVTEPTDDKIRALPAEFSWRQYIGKTSYQNWYGSCTSLWWTHCMQIQNIDEILSTYPEEAKNIFGRIWEWDNIINLDRRDLWTKMWHNLDDKNDSGDYVENMLNTLRKKWITWKWYNWKPKTYFSDGFAQARSPKTDEGINEMKLNLTKSPLVFVIKGNNVTRNEMMKWRVTTILWPKDWDWAHCIAWDWYDVEDCNFLNSRKTNNWSINICSFDIDWETLKKMVEIGQINWRYWQIFDKKDLKQELQFYNRKMQNMETVRQLKKSHEKWDNEDKLMIEKSWLGNYFRKKYWFTDKDL